MKFLFCSNSRVLKSICLDFSEKRHRYTMNSMNSGKAWRFDLIANACTMYTYVENRHVAVWLYGFLINNSNDTNCLIESGWKQINRNWKKKLFIWKWLKNCFNLYAFRNFESYMNVAEALSRKRFFDWNFVPHHSFTLYVITC